MEENIRKTAIDCLLAICEDPEARSSDRVAAAKLLLELDRPEDLASLSPHISTRQAIAVCLFVSSICVSFFMIVLILPP